MPFLNAVHLMGHLTDDLELRHLPSGNAVANFSVGVSGGRSKDGKPRKGEFFDCEIWDGWAQNLAKTARKGALVVLEGRLVQDKWVDAKTNQTRSRVRVRAHRAFHVQAQYGDSRPGGEPTSLEDEEQLFGSHANSESVDETDG